MLNRLIAEHLDAISPDAIHRISEPLMEMLMAYGMFFRELLEKSMRPKDVQLLWETLRRVQEIHAFHLLAYVMLPDHFHWLIRPGGNVGNFSEVLHSVKRNYTLNFKKAHGLTASFHLW